MLLYWYYTYSDKDTSSIDDKYLYIAIGDTTCWLRKNSRENKIYKDVLRFQRKLIKEAYKRHKKEANE